MYVYCTYHTILLLDVYVQIHIVIMYCNYVRYVTEMVIKTCIRKQNRFTLTSALFVSSQRREVFERSCQISMLHRHRPALEQCLGFPSGLREKVGLMSISMYVLYSTLLINKKGTDQGASM